MRGTHGALAKRSSQCLESILFFGPCSLGHRGASPAAPRGGASVAAQCAAR